LSAKLQTRGESGGGRLAVMRGVAELVNGDKGG